jgi:hypothetical protein
MLVIDDRVQFATTNTASGTSFAHSLYTQPQSNTVMWASFTINLSTLPENAGGSYFADFADNAFDFYGRIFVLTSNNPAYTPDIPNVAYPGTYRLGIANKAGTPSAVAELDMAPGIDYNVVAYFDIGGGSQIAINPSQNDYDQVFTSGAPTTLVSGFAEDTYTAPTSLTSYAFRQAAGCGIFELDNLEVSYDWSTNGSGFAAVTANMTPTLPVIGLLTPGLTNYVGNPGLLEVAASGIDLSYAWYQGTNALSDTTNFQGSATSVLSFSYLAATNAGDYYVVVSNAAGAVTSAVSVVDLNTNLTAPIFTLEPVSITTSLGSTVTFKASAVGTGPITYQWYTDGSAVSGATESSFTLVQVPTDISGETNYVVVTGPGGSVQSSNVILTVNGPIVTNIAYLRSLMVTSAAPTITLSTGPAASAAYQITGVVTCAKDLESASYADYTIQDSTAGIEFFVADTTFRPNL